MIVYLDFCVKAHGCRNAFKAHNLERLDNFLISLDRTIRANKVALSYARLTHNCGTLKWKITKSIKSKLHKLL